MALTQKKFEEKQAELLKLANSIDTWRMVPMNKSKEEKINYLFEKLTKDLYEIECQFLEVKLEAYKVISEEIKK